MQLQELEQGREEQRKRQVQGQQLLLLSPLLVLQLLQEGLLHQAGHHPAAPRPGEREQGQGLAQEQGLQPLLQQLLVQGLLLAQVQQLPPADSERDLLQRSLWLEG